MSTATTARKIRGGPAFAAKRALARAIGAASSRSGRGGGTTLPGRVLLRLEPEAIARLGAGLTGGATIVSATNGKTTTAGMIAAILAAEGRPPVHNRAGSNMTWGVATALLEQRGAEGLFEVDEAWLPRVAEQLEPKLIVLGNLFRDQLDRYGEMEALAEEWAKAVAAAPAGTGLALNADDPLIATDRLFIKHGYLPPPDLITYVREQGADRVLVCGIQADTCCLAAGFLLFDAGLRPTLLKWLTVGSSLDPSASLGAKLWKHHFGQDSVLYGIEDLARG